MNIYRNNQGFIIIEDILGGEYKSKSYLYYTKQQAIKNFKEHYKKYYHKNGRKKLI